MTSITLPTSSIEALAERYAAAGTGEAFKISDRKSPGNWRGTLRKEPTRKATVLSFPESPNAMTDLSRIMLQAAGEFNRLGDRKTKRDLLGRGLVLERQKDDSIVGLMELLKATKERLFGSRGGYDLAFSVF